MEGYSMKKIIILITALTMLLVLSGCHKNELPEDDIFELVEELTGIPEVDNIVEDDQIELEPEHEHILVKVEQFAKRMDGLEKGKNMSKYDELWMYIKNNDEDYIKLTFDEIAVIIGESIDHSFLKYKKQLIEYGYQVEKISMKEQTVIFKKVEK